MNVTKKFIEAVRKLVDGVDGSVVHHGPYGLPLQEQKRVRDMLKKIDAKDKER